MSSRGRLVAATFCAGAVAALAAAPAEAETLADAIALAYQNNPTLQAQRAIQKEIDENYVQARTGWRPTLSATGSWAYGETSTPEAALIAEGALGTPTRFHTARVTGGVTFSQPLWTGGRVAAAVNAANADVLAGQEKLRQVESQVLVAVIQAYSDVRLAQESLQIQQNNVSVLTRQLQESQARFDVGEVTRTDVAQSQARLAQAQALLQSAVAQLAVSRATYANLVGQNPGDLAPPPSLAYLLPKDADEAFKLADAFNPQVRSQEFTELGSRARVEGARAERMPEVSAQASVQFQNQNRQNIWDNSYFSRGTSLGVSVTVPLFQGGLVQSRVRQAIQRNNADRITIEAFRRNVLQNVTTFWSELIAARTNIASSDEQVRAARIAWEGTRQEQQVGLRTTIDVLNAEQELRQAELNAVTSRRDEYVAAANVLASVGRLEAKDLTPTIPRYDADKNFRRLRITWGWVPWEEPIGLIDQALTPWPSQKPHPMPQEAPIGPGLQQAPAAPPAAPSEAEPAPPPAASAEAPPVAAPEPATPQH